MSQFRNSALSKWERFKEYLKLSQTKKAIRLFSGAILIFGAILLNAAFSSKEIITYPFSSTGYSSNGEEFFGGFASSSGSGYGTLHHDDIYAKGGTDHTDMTSAL